jgi:hypothetical protein
MLLIKLIAKLIFSIYSEFEVLWNEKHKSDNLSYSTLPFNDGWGSYVGWTGEASD